MVDSVRPSKKDRIDTLTPSLRVALMRDGGSKTLDPDDHRRVRRALSILPEKRAVMLDDLIALQRDNGGAGVRRAELAMVYQSDRDFNAGAPVKPLLPYLVKHLESLVAAGIVEKHPSGKGAELLYTVLPGVVRVRREIREDLRRRREDEQRRADAAAAAAGAADELRAADVDAGRDGAADELRAADVDAGRDGAADELHNGAAGAVDAGRDGAALSNADRFLLALESEYGWDAPGFPAARVVRARRWRGLRRWQVVALIVEALAVVVLVGLAVALALR